MSTLRVPTAIALLAILGTVGCEPALPGTLLIRGATLVDGTGTPRRLADVRVDGDLIREVGSLTPMDGEPVVEANGLVLAPGFIDTHSHHGGGLPEEPGALAVVSQGVTTIIVGQDGGSRHPLTELFEALEAAPAAVNVASYAGHNTLRRRVMGEDFRREATEAEIEAMRELLAVDMNAGALGLSTGLEYDPGIYSAPEEVLRLAREAARHGGRYISHMRSEDRAFWDALDELLTIGREAEIPVQISHMKLAARSLWGRADEVLALLDRARAEGVDVTADVYPYEYWQSTMTVLLPERDFSDRAAFQFALDELVPPEGFLIARFGPNPEYVGMTLAEVASERGQDPVTTYMELVAEARGAERGRGGESMIGTSMTTEDIETLLAWPHTNVSSDGSLRGRHPRGFGSFPRVLAGTVRGRRKLMLEEAIHRMSGLAATHMGLEDRGVIRPGARADLVLLDPERVQDRATPEDPQAVSIGIERVWVNGVEVYRDGEVTGEHPGVVLRRTTEGEERE